LDVGEHGPFVRFAGLRDEPGIIGVLIRGDRVGVL
jgi:hypothetical protein